MTDASDSLIVDTEDILIDKFLSFNKPIVVSGERNCWPQDLIAPYFPTHNDPSPWKYLNSGGYMGKRQDLIALLTLMDSHERLQCPDIGIKRSNDWINDQFLMSLAYIQNQEIFHLDTKCELFQTMGDNQKHDVGIVDKKPVNTVHSTRPSVIHFNGHAKGIDFFFENCLCG